MFQVHPRGSKYQCSTLYCPVITRCVDITLLFPAHPLVDIGPFAFGDCQEQWHYDVRDRVFGWKYVFSFLSFIPRNEIGG